MVRSTVALAALSLFFSACTPEVVIPRDGEDAGPDAPPQDASAQDTGGDALVRSDVFAVDAGIIADGSMSRPDTPPGLDAGPDSEAPLDAGPIAPPGASCTHSTGGGIYAHTACSAGFQCCDGTFRTRETGCGVCLCVEPTGNTGCGTTTMPPTGGVHAGLSQSGSQIPRAGLENSTGGVGLETEGDVVVVDGEQWVRGTISNFGGPNDTGVSTTETGAITGERLRSLNTPMDASRSVIESRPEDFYYAAMRWSYSPGNRSFWRDARILIRNPATGAQVVVRPVDWGPHIRTGRIIDVAPQTEDDLGVSTDANVDVAFALPGTPLGPVL
ncbi:MAG: hypothetical protein ACI9KE_003032 [Polyangiales bacterium]|jgi:hypothetical protein